MPKIEDYALGLVVSALQLHSGRSCRSDEPVPM